MNKDVIYIEPEDDITDIISKLESAKEKIVALVPPKKNGVLRSAVNIKLVAKTSAAAGKNVVLVTTDPSILKLAANIKIPVTKDLKSAPSIPNEEDINEEVITEEVVEDEEKDIKVVDSTIEEPKEEVSEEDAAVDAAIAESAIDEQANPEKVEESEEKNEKKADKKAKSEKKSKFAGNPFFEWLKTYKKWVIAGASILTVLIIFSIWAFVIAPAVKITVAIRTDSNNFSEAVSFTTDQSKENVEEGVFYLEEIKIEEEQKTEFTATGNKNIGEKAKGDVVIYAFFRKNDNISVNAGSAFTYNGLTFYSNEDVTLAWDGNGPCDNSGNTQHLINNGCKVSARVPVTAAAAGANYNVDASDGGWSTSAKVGVYSDSAMTGGTDKTVTVVTKENVAAAKEKIANNNKEKEEEIKAKLYEQVGDSRMAITSSYKQSISDPESTPKVDEEVSTETIPSIKVTTTTSVFVVDKTKIEEFITNKAKITDEQKVYAINNPFIESFLATDDGYSGKLKTSYLTGPKITENDVLEIVKGKGIGDIQHDLKSINGISEISIDTSFPWVTSAPGDSNKITIELTVKDEESKE